MASLTTSSTAPLERPPQPLPDCLLELPPQTAPLMAYLTATLTASSIVPLPLPYELEHLTLLN